MLKLDSIGVLASKETAAAGLKLRHNGLLWRLRRVIHIIY
jgi:hypothetical protein